MPLAQPIVFGNWKMNGLRSEGLALAGGLAERVHRLSGTLGVFPPFTILRDVAHRLAGSGIVVGAQDCHERASGASTGEISAAMVRDAGATAVILGHSERRHSERRHATGECDARIRDKVTAAQGEGLSVILCIGETEAEWQAGRREEVLCRQLRQSLPDRVDEEKLVVAYEPVWAIGTGRTATTAEIEATHLLIGRELRGRGLEPPVLYGGSVKPDNAVEIMGLAPVAGVLVGGASLDVGSFWSIYQAGGGT
jgi:triosephosphate isomerase